MSRQLFEEARKVLQAEAAVKLDPVGQEDKDVDNDGDSDKTDSYLKKRRGAISAAIAKSKNEGVELSQEDAQRISAILKGIAVDEAKKMEDDKEEMEDEDEDEDDKKSMKEESEQIDEVSRETLAAYKNKASDAKYRKTLSTSKLDKREAGVAMAMKKLDKKNEETEQIDESDDLGPVKKKQKTVLLVHKTSGREKVIVDTPENRKKNADLGFHPMKKESVEQVDEGQSHQAKTTMKHIVNPTPGEKEAAKNIKPGIAGYRDRIAMLKSAQARGALQKEETEQEDFELIEKFEVNIPEQPSYQDYVKAALKIAECNSFAELSEEDQQYIMNELEEAVKSNNVSFIFEAEALSDMNDTVQRLRKAGHKVEDMGRDFKGNPFYMYVDKTTGMRRKVTYRGTQKMTQNMGRVQPEKEEE